MRKESGRQKQSRKAANPPLGWRWLFFFFILLVAIGSTSFVVYRFKQAPEQYPVLSAYRVKLEAWIDQRKKHINKEIVKAKQVATNQEDEESQVKFEFYNTLPNMQMSQKDSK